MDLDFFLNLDERLPDRVQVSVLLRPRGDQAAVVQGVSVELVGELGERLSHQLRLPIAGSVAQPMRMTVELRSLQPLPMGARVVATAWSAAEQWEASCPADPGTQLEAHVRGLNALRSDNDEVFEPLLCAERGRLWAVLPWLQPCQPPLLKMVETEQTNPASVRSFCHDLGLGDEGSEWLEDLLNDPD